MNWIVRFHPDFEEEFDAFARLVRRELLAQVRVLEQYGPNLGRPRVDTLNGSRYANMKELRFNAANGVWRAAFAFDPERRAIILVAGDKSGVSQRRFYRALIRKADDRFSNHLAELRNR